MNIEQLKTANEAELADINKLLIQLAFDPASFKSLSLERLKEILNNDKTVVMVARDNNRIIGMGIIYFIQKPCNSYGYIEDMAVDDAYRGKGIGTAIATHLIDIARSNGVKIIELSARPSRVAANKLYQKLGFEQKETNVYRMKL